MKTRILANNNKSFVKKIARRSIGSSRMRTVMSLLAVILAAALISGLSMFSLGLNEKTDRQLDTMQHVIYGNLTKEQCDRLRADERVDDSLMMKTGLASEMDGYTIQLSYTEQKKSSIAAADIKEGKYPEKMYEAAVDKAYMKRLGLPLQLGRKLTFRYYDGTTETFRISGFTDTGIKGKHFTVMVSRAYAEKGRQLAEMPYMLPVKITGAEAMSKEAFLSEMISLGEDYGVKRSDMNENNRFALSLGVDVNMVLTIAVIAVFVLFASFVVVYSIFYISVISRIRQFGQLMTLGASPKQIRKIVRKEGGYMFALGTPPGLLIGMLFGYFTQPEGWLFSNACIVAAAVLVLSYLTVMLSVWKPAKLAGAVSPIEAAKASGYEKVQCKGIGRFRPVTPWNLAKMSPARNRRKFVITVLSLCISGVIFIVGTTFLESFNKMEFFRQGEMQYSEYQINISQNAVNSNDQGMSGVQKKNPFSRELIEKIKNIEGVREVIPVDKIDVSFNIDDSQSDDAFVPFDRKDADFLKKYLEDGTLNYDEAVKNNYIYVIGNGVAKELYGREFKTGEKLKFTWSDGTKKHSETFKIAGIVDKKVLESRRGYLTAGPAGFFIVPRDTLAAMMPGGFNMCRRLLIATDWPESEKAVTAQLTQIVRENGDLSLDTLRENMKKDEETWNLLYSSILGLSLLLILFGVISLVNTVVTGIVTRKQEFAMLESIGMERRQLVRMIQGEGFIIAFYNVLVSLLLGSAAGFGIVRFMAEHGAPYLHYHFPLWYAAAYVILAAGLPALVSAVCVRSFDRTSIVERLRKRE